MTAMSKAGNLEIMQTCGIQVPNGFTLGAEHYHPAVKPLLRSIEAAIEKSTPVEQVFRSLIIPDETKEYIENQLLKLSGARRFAVRSSGNVVQSGEIVPEDGVDVALAGQFDSFLNVPAELVPEAVLKCWASLFNERSISSFAIDHDYIHLSGMSVVIQEMIPAKASAVMMTCDPSGNGETGAIEFTWGPCEAIVAGIVNPDEAIFNRQGSAIRSTRIGSKVLGIEYADFSSACENANRIRITEDLRSRLALSMIEIGDLIALGRRVEEIFGCPQDIEAVVTYEGRVVITQARPITTLPKNCSSFS